MAGNKRIKMLTLAMSFLFFYEAKKRKKIPRKKEKSRKKDSPKISKRDKLGHLCASFTFSRFKIKISHSCFFINNFTSTKQMFMNCLRIA